MNNEYIIISANFALMKYNMPLGVLRRLTNFLRIDRSL